MPASEPSSPLLMALLMALPWLLAMGVFMARVRLPRPLSAATPGDMDGPAPSGERDKATGLPSAHLVSVVIPARNEARNIGRVLTSVVATTGVDFEVLVVDDRSDDDTAAQARAVPPGRAARVEVIDGAALPDGWLGKNWACAQGAARARGDVLLFTDADTIHGATLLVRALAALDRDHADALTLAGRQLMGTFWERLVQPQVFMGILLRYPDTRTSLPPARWRDAIANGQYILITREAYAAIGGHEALRGEVVEDMRMAQRLVRLGRRLVVRAAEDDFATRMYTGLGELVEGWSKNIVLGGLATLPSGWIRRLAPPLAIALGTLFWIVPPVVLAASALAGWPGRGSGDWLLAWAAIVSAASALFWSAVSWRMRIPALYGMLYPLGAAVAHVIYLRAWLRAGEVEWKGRRYRVDPEALMGEPHP